ncbi:L-rhamnose mutarotase [Leadbetterella sp. DM7]|uniref:L-rhamnose mutarotase n=1 Tax=Leadbetterella sp. DM7 TaxID=3235085 RepID=UPI00349EF0EB
MQKFALVLDLVNDPALIAEYEKYHREVWPEIIQSIRDSGIRHMDIYRFDSRLFMVMETEDDFSFEKKAEMDNLNPKVQEWEELMWKYQQALPGSPPGAKWLPAKLVFHM